jgi:hypothetical protein
VNYRFAALADQFITRIQAAKIDPATEVVLICHCEGFSPVRVALDAGTFVDTINSLVRHAPKGLVLLHGGPGFPVRITDFSLEIRHACHALSVPA